MTMGSDPYADSDGGSRTYFPGDVISTGTPGAVVLRDGDVLECRIEGLTPLKNPVRRY